MRSRTWREQFAKVSNGSYILRGLEMTLRGQVRESSELLTLVRTDERPDIALAPIQAPDKVNLHTGMSGRGRFATGGDHTYRRTL